MLKKMLMMVISLVLLGGKAVLAQDFEYIGAAKCKMCHNKEATGMQYKKWAESAHANAYKTLASAKSLEIAKKKGIENPQKDPKCLKCHATAAHVKKSLVQASMTIEEGVSCEDCHGPGSVYKSNAIMKNRAQALKSGMVIPNEKTCVRCHNPESPTYKPFNYAEFNKKIDHSIPK